MAMNRVWSLEYAAQQCPLESLWICARIFSTLQWNGAKDGLFGECKSLGGLSAKLAVELRQPRHSAPAGVLLPVLQGLPGVQGVQHVELAPQMFKVNAFHACRCYHLGF